MKLTDLFRNIPLIEQVERFILDTSESLIREELELCKQRARVRMYSEHLRYLQAQRTALTKAVP